MKKTFLLCSGFLFVILAETFPLAIASVKAGASCSKLNATATKEGTKYTCIKSGKKLIWNKGIKVNISTPGPVISASPITSPSANNFANTNVEIYFQSPRLAMSDLCRLKDSYISKVPGDNYNNIGFPIKVHEVPISGKVNILFLPVKFADMPETKIPREQFNLYIQNLNLWAKQFSNNQLLFNFSFPDQWISLKEKSTEFDIQRPDSSGIYLKNYENLASKIIAAADPHIDFKGINAIFVYWSSQPKNFQYDLGLRDYEIKSSEGIQRVFMWSQGPFIYTDIQYSTDEKQKRLWQFYLHEMLHSQGIMGHAPAGFETSIGNQILGSSSAMDAWSAFLAGWTKDEQIYCSPSELIENSTVIMSPLDEIGGQNVRAILIPIDAHQVIVVESRKSVDFSSNWPTGTRGLLVYLVDTAKRNDVRNPLPSNSRKFDSWSYYLPSNKLLASGKDIEAIVCEDEKNQQGCGGLIRDFREFLIKEGEDLIYAGVKIQLVKSGITDVVKLSKVN